MGHIFMSSTFSFFLGIPERKTRQKISELDVFTNIYENYWYHWNMKWLTVTCREIYTLLSLNYMENSLGFMLSVASCLIPWGVRLKIRSTGKRNFLMICDPSNTQHPTPFLHALPFPSSRRKKWSAGNPVNTKPKEPLSVVWLPILAIPPSYTPR